MSTLIPIEQLQAALERFFVAHSLFRFDAKTVSERLVESELYGRSTHGLVLLPRIIQAIQDGHVDPRAKILKLMETPAITILDGGRSVGMLAATQAARLASENAKTSGIALVGVKNSQTLGAAEVYVRLMSAQKVIGLCITSTGGATVTAPGTHAGAVGNAAISYAIPLSQSHPVVFDSACGVDSWGQLRYMKKMGIPIPSGILFDEQREGVDDPDLAAAMLPAGGALGYGISLLVSILAGPLLSGLMPIKKTRPVDSEDSQHLFVAIDPAKFVNVDRFESEVLESLELIRRLPAESRDLPVRIPGDRGAELHAAGLKNGIHLSSESELILRPFLESKS